MKIRGGLSIIFILEISPKTAQRLSSLHKRCYSCPHSFRASLALCPSVRRHERQSLVLPVLINSAVNSGRHMSSQQRRYRTGGSNFAAADAAMSREMPLPPFRLELRRALLRLVFSPTAFSGSSRKRRVLAVFEVAKEGFICRRLDGGSDS